MDTHVFALMCYIDHNSMSMVSHDTVQTSYSGLKDCLEPKPTSTSECNNRPREYMDNVYGHLCLLGMGIIPEVGGPTGYGHYS